MKEYLPKLNARLKWTEVVKDLKKGDIVLILKPKLLPGKWPLGRIVDAYPEIDKCLKVVKVQCGEKTVVRAIYNLVPLL